MKYKKTDINIDKIDKTLDQEINEIFESLVLSNNSLTHIALILDGNKRWSKLNNKSNNLDIQRFENIKKIANMHYQ